MHFSGLTYTVLSLFFSDPDMHPLDFSLLNRREADEEPEDDVLMQKAAGLAGGVRFGPDGKEVIPTSPDVADMTEDDVKRGFPSGSIKPPCVCCLHSSPTWPRSLQAGKVRG